MADQLTKLRPDHDLQCFFFQPSAVAALSATSATGFTVSGSFRQQFDWVVAEWNRDNVFEHPALRNLPDGDLSGLHLTYQETRVNCIPLDSTLFPTVDWPYLRIWDDSGVGEVIHQIPLKNYATPVGTYTEATVQFELQGSITAGDYIELAWLDQHFNYLTAAGDTLATAASALAGIITSNHGTGVATATASGSRITLTYLGGPGSNSNRIGVYGTVHGAGTESWAPASALFRGGVSPDTWHVDLDFSNLTDVHGTRVTTTHVRKMRWTWAADLQPSSFSRSEFSVTVSSWTVIGAGSLYQVAGPGSRRVEDDSTDLTYSNPSAWTATGFNFSGGSIRYTTTPGAFVQYSYSASEAHTLYLGTRYVDGGSQITIVLDGNTLPPISLSLPLEDVLVRIPVGQLSALTQHTITATHTGGMGAPFYFDFFEIAVPTANLPVFSPAHTTTLATDWDTLHSQALAPERTAWLMHTLGFNGRANHYAGALWFYELHRPGQHYASGTISFSGNPEFGKITEIDLGPTPILHVNLIGDTAATIATAFALLINAGSTGVWAQAAGAILTITARAMGADGNSIGIAANTNSLVFTAQVSAATLSGGGDDAPPNQQWLTDLNAMPRMNRAARDWSTSFFQALKGYGIDVAASFSMELGNGDDAAATGIAQRYPNGDPVLLNTPALQTNFGPASTAFWQQVYLDMANVMATAGITPYLQFGEVQWWYFAAASGMPFYDAYTTSTFQTAFGRALPVITSQNTDPSTLTEETAFLAGLIGAFTDTIMQFVRQSQPSTRFEVLYPPDTNDTALNRLVNYPVSHWTPTSLACLKTENFTFTGDRDLDKARGSIQVPMQYGFPPSQASHLVGISDYTTPWARERRLAMAAGLESVVLFALDQFCLIGYSLPLAAGPRRAQFMGV